MRSCRLAAPVAALMLVCGIGLGARAEDPAPAPAKDPAALPDVSAGPANDQDGSHPSTAIDRYDPLYGEDEEIEDVESISDPLEPMNRVIFRFNRAMDIAVLDPLTRGYRFLVPAPARRGIQRAFHNLNSPVIFANLILQGRGRDAAVTVGRFATNTTLGAVGFFDYANDVIGWHRTDADFGQTLGLYGVGAGPYLVVPLFGPSSTRDAFGNVMDQVMDPLTYFVAPLQIRWAILFGGSQGFSYREQNIDALDALRDASVDFYAALRSAYAQARQGAVKEAHEARGPLYNGSRNVLGKPIRDQRVDPEF